jgi:hypothetical protein
LGEQFAQVERIIAWSIPVICGWLKLARQSDGVTLWSVKRVHVSRRSCSTVVGAVDYAGAGTPVP